MRSNLRLTFQIVLFCSLIPAAQAAQKRYCASNVASTTSYYTPVWQDYCPGSWNRCSKDNKDAFDRIIQDRGSGILPGRQIKTYTGKTYPQGKCETSYGSSGRCLTPYVSVAADPKYYRMGDIIEMPSMKCRVFTLANGKTFIHPGYFIVEDKGGAVKGGPNRFDFYTGLDAVKSVRNPFGYKGPSDMRMTDRKRCDSFKQFTVIRGGDKNRAENARLAIASALENASENLRYVASTQAPVRSSRKVGSQQ